MRGAKEVNVKSSFSAARRHLEEAHRLLPGDDELSVKSCQALEILIDALLAAEFQASKEQAKVVDLGERRQRYAGRG